MLYRDCYGQKYFPIEIVPTCALPLRHDRLRRVLEGNRFRVQERTAQVTLNLAEKFDTAIFSSIAPVQLTK